MKRLYTYMWVLGLLFACKKNPVQTSDMIYSLTPTPAQIEADGTSLITVLAEINPDTDPAKRTVIFKASTGDFVGGSGSVLSKKAELEGDKLIARVQYKAPSKPGTVTLQAKMDLPNEKKEYWAFSSVEALESKPAVLKLSASAFGVMINFGSEVTLTGSLLNTSGKPASSGYKVVLEDYYENKEAVNGRFRDAQLTTGADSKITAVYSPGFVPPAQKIWLRATLLDAGGGRTAIKDSVLIQTIPN